jgi:serine/threonine protein phosphatase PrpC
MTNAVRDEDIALILSQQEESAAQVCQRLVERALTAGGKDDVTVIVARYGFPSS